MNRSSVMLLAVLTPAIFSCSGMMTKERTDYSVSAPDYISSSGSIMHDIEDSEVAELWKRSETAFAAKQYENAIKYINSALALNADDAVIWSRGAEMYLGVGENALAENYAVKSNSFADIDSRSLRYRNWLIIQHAREMRGDLLGARNAQEKVLKYQPLSTSSD